MFDKGNTSKDLRRKGEEMRGGWEVVKGNSTIKRSRGVTQAHFTLKFLSKPMHETF